MQSIRNREREKRERKHPLIHAAWGNGTWCKYINTIGCHPGPQLGVGALLKDPRINENQKERMKEEKQKKT